MEEKEKNITNSTDDEDLVAEDFEDVEDEEENEETEEEPSEEEKGTDQTEKENSDTSSKNKNQKPKKQSRDENAKYADIRRRNKELEKENQELKEKVSRADFNGRKKAISSETLDALGLDAIEDEDDLFRCETYEKAIKRDSDNPLLDVEKAYTQRVKAERKKREDEIKVKEENERLLREDQANFLKKFGKETSEVLKDKRFMALFGDKITYGNFTELYSRYVEAFELKEKEDEEQSKKMGQIPGSNTKPNNTHQSINDIDDDEAFLKAFDAKYHNKK